MLKLQTAHGPDFTDSVPATDAYDLGLPARTRDAADPLHQLEADERADWALLRVVLCAALATLALAVATMLA